MASYMPQHLFDMAVVTTVKLHMTTGDPVSQVCREICRHYRFSGEGNLKGEIEETSQQLLQMMRSQFDDEQLPSVMTQLQFCITNYELNGEKKQKRFFGGTWLTRSKSRNPNRAKDCLRNVFVYHTGTLSGMFPLAPTGWSLENREPSNHLHSLAKRNIAEQTSVLISDTEKTLSEMRALSEVAQRVIAVNVYNEIMQSLRQIEGTPGPSSQERDQVIRDQLNRAKAARDRALSRGAKNWADPDWAAAAIFESWLMANSGSLGRKAYDEIAGLIISWLRSVLRDSDFEKFEQS